MRISYNWLKDYIDIKFAPEKLAETLTMAGLTVDSVRKLGNDHILEVEVTANRPDWLSYIGIARELAAITGRRLKMPRVSQLAGLPVSRLNRQTGKQANRLTIKVEDAKLCPRYTARIIRGVKVGESPAWLKTKLEAMGLRPVNNVVDVTNFCLFETGEPMHAFDIDRLEGKAVIVRRTRNGERITTIDGEARTLDGETLVIADSSKPVAIAGIMGGLDTEVTASTKNILLEAAYFDPISVRRAARKMALASESSYRFERKVNIANIPASSGRALQLILDLAGGQAGEFIDTGKIQAKKKTMGLRFERLNSILGIKIPMEKAKSILTALGAKVKSSSAKAVKVEPPAFRYDLASEIDLIEEIARIYGYDRIPETIPPVVKQPVRESPGAIVDKVIRQRLTGLGCDEIISYSLLSKKIISGLNIPADATVEILNPLSAEQEAMRPTLLAGMLGAISWNINRKAKDLRLFELGGVYLKGPGSGFIEKKNLSIAITGEISSWVTGTRPAEFFDLKGIVETLFSELGIENVSYKFEREDAFSPSSCSSIEIGGERIGVLGAASPRALNNFDIKEEVYACEICIDSVLKHVNLGKRFRELAKYPSVFRDISIVIGKDILAGELAGAIRNAGGPILKDAKLIDRYTGKQVPDGKVSLTYRLEYRDPAKTLEEKEVSDLHAGILRSLEEKFGARLR